MSLRNLTVLVGSVLCLLTGPVAGQQTGTPFTGPVFGAESFTLANGLTVVAIPNHRAPVVSHMVWYKIGAADEQPGKSGLAHFLEHLMFKGTARYPAGKLTDIVARNGGDQNAFTSYDYTAYFENTAVAHLPLMMDIEADRMRNLKLDAPAVNTEREVIIEERRMRVDSVPAAVLGERLSPSLWMTNHYGIPVIGWEAEMRGLSREDALAFYRAHYAAHNAIVVVAGDITAAQLKPLAEKYYGAIPKTGDPAPRVRSTYLPRRADVRVVMTHERVEQPEWSRLYIAPSYNVGDRVDVHGLEVFAEILGGGSTTKLYRTLVVDQKLAAEASASYEPDAISYGTFSVLLTPNPGVPVDKLEAAYDMALESILRDGISDADVARAKSRMIARLAYAKDSPMKAAYEVGSSLAAGLTLDDIENWPAAIATVTADQVRAAAHKLVATASTGTGILLPQPQAQGAGAAP
ncbi:MAG: insulinase family protein [Rhodospirillaceae bacterium]|nr:MAG: insulinase family protein [Rhodospirillaceae bacterium]